MTHDALLLYVSPSGIERSIVFPSVAKAKVFLKDLKKKRQVKTYMKGHATLARITKLDRCPLCKSFMFPEEKPVWLLHQKPEEGIMQAHQGCCERNKVPYRSYETGEVIYPK